MINKKKLSINICFLIIFIIILILFIVPFDRDNEERVAICGGGHHELIIPVDYNNITKNFEIIIGPIMDSDGNSMENVNVSIEFNRTLFYNFTNSMGFAKIIIPEILVSKEDLNTTVTVRCKAEEYDDLIFKIDLEYP